MRRQASVPVDQEPMHKVVLKNEHVEVLHVSVPPGLSTLFHTHSRDAAVLDLSETQIRIDVPGNASEVRQNHPGDVSAPGYANTPLTHRVNNISQVLFEALDVEFVKRPDGVTTKAFEIPAAENGSMRVYKWNLAPAAASPQHTHERPYLIIAATTVDLRMASPDGNAVKHIMQPGDFHWVDSKVTHTLINGGESHVVIVEVELK